MAFRMWLLALVALVMTGCAQGPSTVGGAAETSGAVLMQVGEYRLGAGDELRITVFGEDELTGEYVVGGQGVVAFPLVGDVDAAGKTLSEFARHLEARLLAGFVRAPRVSVEVTNYRPFFILGEVNTPGTYPYSSGLTVMNAAATAGGFTYRADTRRVYIKHVGEPDERAYTLTSQTPVQPGDTVRIGERRF